MTDGRRVRGDRTREAILGPAVALATVKGIDGFSLAELAEATGASKAGIATLFGGKQELQAAIAARARLVLDERVFRPVMASPPGLARLATLGTAWIDYLSDPDLVGGCFFAAAMYEMDARPGPLRDLVGDDMRRWIDGIRAMVEDAQAREEVDPSVDAADEAFDLFSIGVTTNGLIQLGDDRAAERARRVWGRHLDRLRADPDPTTGAPA